MGERDIQTLWFIDHSSISIGNVVERIFLKTDGCGLSGYYDRIHIQRKDGSHSVHPAHNVGGWLWLPQSESDDAR